MKRYIRSSAADILDDMTQELDAILDEEGSGAAVVGTKTGKKYYLYEDYKGEYKIYLTPSGLLRHPQEQQGPYLFKTLTKVAEWLYNH